MLWPGGEKPEPVKPTPKSPVEPTPKFPVDPTLKPYIEPTPKPPMEPTPIPPIQAIKLPVEPIPTCEYTVEIELMPSGFRTDYT